MSLEQPLDVLATCAKVHGAYTGIAPDISDEALRAAVEALRVRLAEWAPSYGRGIAYDAVVHELVRIAISDGECALADRGVRL